MIRAALIALALSALSLYVHAQTPGTLNLTGPSTTPGAPQLTPQALNDGINAQLGLKADAAATAAAIAAAAATANAALPTAALPAALAAPTCIGCTTPGPLNGLVTPLGGIAAPLSGMLSTMRVPANNNVCFLGDSITIAANQMNVTGVTASGGTAPYTFSVTGLPSTIPTATSTPTLFFETGSSTPSSGLATTAVSITATDNVGATGSRTYTLAIAPQSFQQTLVATGASTGALSLDTSIIRTNVSNRGAQFWVPFLTDNRAISPPSLNFGQSGDTTTGLLARIGAPVAANCGSYHVMIGVNDLNNTQTNPSIATVEANLTSIYTALLTTGRPVVLSTILPRNLTSNPLAVDMLWQVNQWIRSRAGTIAGLYVVDPALFYGDPQSLTATPVTGPTSIYNYSYDGLHPMAIGAFHAFTPVANLFGKLYPNTRYRLASASDVFSVTNPIGNLLSNGMMTFAGVTGTVGGKVSGVAPDGWSAFNADASCPICTYTAVSSPSTLSDGVTPAAKLTIAGTAQGGFATVVAYQYALDNLTNYAVGDVLRLSCRVEVAGGSQHVTPPYLQLSYLVGGVRYTMGAGLTGAINPAVSDASPREAYAGTIATPDSIPLPGTISSGTVQVGLYLTNGAALAVAGSLKVGACKLAKVI
jgi:hypothetical protein